MNFRDRRDAGRRLTGELSAYSNRSDVVVLGLPRGGVPVAYEVARALNAPLDVFVVRKLGLPGHREFAMGALASGGVRVMNPDVTDLRIPAQLIAHVTEREWNALQRQEVTYRGNRPFASVRDRTVILVDDGLATGSTMRAAAAALRSHAPARIVVAVPVGAPATRDDLRTEVNDVICAISPDPFYAVGLWYADFSQTTDEEVTALLAARVSEGVSC